MTQLRSPVTGLGSPALGDLFPTYLPDPEQLVYEYVAAATQWHLTFPEDPGTPRILPVAFDEPPTLAYFDPLTSNQEAPPVLVVRGHPAYPGQLPAIGVTLGSETEDDSADAVAGGYAGDAQATDETGAVVATASYYSEPLYVTVVVLLIEENRDERDRLHNQLRRALFPLRRILPGRDNKIRKVRVDAEKGEADGEIDQQPFVVYTSTFTVHCYCELLEAVDVTGADGSIEAVTTEVIVLDPSTDPATLTPPPRPDL